MKVYTPVKDANGVWATVRFVNGVGETENPRLIEWFKNHGYTVEETQSAEDLIIEAPIETPTVITETEPDDEMMGYADKEPNFDDMTPNELREWARANGLGGAIKNIRNKEKLLEIIRG